MKVNDMDKYQLTETMKSVITYLADPNVSIHDLPEEHYKEIMAIPTDEDGYVHKYYFTDEAKMLIEIIDDMINSTNYIETRFK